MTFDDRDYTFDAIIKQLGLIELHCKDGSASEENCKCIDTKHLYLIEGLSEEGQGFAVTSQEAQFYRQLGDLVRLIRKNMEREHWNLHGVMREVMQKKHPIPLHQTLNPVTACEIEYPSVLKKRKSCVKKLKPKELRGEIENAIAVCRSTIKCPPVN